MRRDSHAHSELTDEVRDSDDVRSRAAAGAAVVGVRGILVQGVGAGGSIVLARLLAPHQFGAAAIGITLIGSLTAIVGPGLGSALVRKPEPPDRTDLETVFVLQLLFGLAIAGIAAATLWPFGIVGQVTAVMLAPLPVTAFRAPNELVLSRNLRFRPVATVEVVELTVFYVWAIATATLGWGAWSLATAMVVRLLVGSALMVILGPVGLVRPVLSRERARGILAYGFRMQGFFLVVAAHEQGMNAGIGAIGGLSSLGFWSLANRILQVPFLLFSSLGRVFFPAMSRLLGSGDDPRRTIERSTALVATATGILVVPIAGAAPALVPVVFGSRWSAAADVLPLAGIGLLIGGPVAVTATNYLWGSGDAQAPLYAVIVQAVTRLSIGLGLLPIFGMWGLGAGWCAASIVEAVMLARQTETRTGARIGRALAAPFAFALVAIATAWIFTYLEEPSILTAVIGILLAEGIYLLGIAGVRRQLLGQLVGTTGQALRGTVVRAAS